MSNDLAKITSQANAHIYCSSSCPPRIEIFSRFFSSLLSLDLKTLKTKRSHLINFDDYGIRDESAWEHEKRHYISSVIPKRSISFTEDPGTLKDIKEFFI